MSIAETIIQEKLATMIADYSLEEVLRAFSQWCEDTANMKDDEYWIGVLIQMRDELDRLARAVAK